MLRMLKKKHETTKGDDVHAAGHVGVHHLVLRVSDCHRHVGNHESHDRCDAGEVQGGQLGRGPPPDAGKSRGEVEATRD